MNLGEIKITKRFFILFFILTTVSFILLNMKYSQFEWARNIIMFRPVHIINLFLYYILGIFIEKNRWFQKGFYIPTGKIWLPIFLISQLFYLFFKGVVPLSNYRELHVIIINSILYNFFSISSIMLLLSCFYKYLNRTNATIKRLTSASYGIYFVHFIFLIIVFYVEKTDFNVYNKFTISLILTLSSSFIITSVFKSSPLLRRMF